MSVPMSLLGLLDREPSHGYDLKRDYDAYFGRGRPLPFSQVYATLARLARDGKAMVGEAEPGSGPDRNRYTITETGKYEVEAWLARPSPTSRPTSSSRLCSLSCSVVQRTNIWMSNVPRTWLECASSPSSSKWGGSSTPSWPTTASSIWKLICAGSISPPPA